jgi:hypothetical protein
MRFSALLVMSNEKGRSVSTSDSGGGMVISIQSLSDTQLIKILQLDDCDDELTQTVEEELARRKSGGTYQ